jgi:sulfide:quinone oxidoreductase
VQILVLGAGFGGLELTSRLCDQLGDEADIVLIDKTEDFVFGFSKLDVMFGRTTPDAVRHPYRDVVRPGVRFVQAMITAIDPQRRRVDTDAGSFDGDVMVVALGADLDPTATPGLVEAGHEFYTEAGAFATRDVLDAFTGGRVIVGVTSTPFKCPPAPSETVLLVHDYLVQRGLRDTSEVSLVMPLPAPIPPSPAASHALLAAFEQRGIGWHPQCLVRELDPHRRVARFADGGEMPFDLFLGVPVHRAPAVVQTSGMCVDGWIPVNPSSHHRPTGAPGSVTSSSVTGRLLASQSRSAAASGRPAVSTMPPSSMRRRSRTSGRIGFGAGSVAIGPATELPRVRCAAKVFAGAAR